MRPGQGTQVLQQMPIVDRDIRDPVCPVIVLAGAKDLEITGGQQAGGIAVEQAMAGLARQGGQQMIEKELGRRRRLAEQVGAETLHQALAAPLPEQAAADPPGGIDGDEGPAGPRRQHVRDLGGAVEVRGQHAGGVRVNALEQQIQLRGIRHATSDGRPRRRRWRTRLQRGIDLVLAQGQAEEAALMAQAQMVDLARGDQQPDRWR